MIALSQEEADKPLAEKEALALYYADKKLLWRNVSFIIVLTVGWSACFSFVNPLIILGLKDAGLKDSTLGLLAGANQWIYSYLVMYFAWKSDHTQSRMGRRLPYLLVSSPVIILVICLFPLFRIPGVLVLLYMINGIFMDIKAATIPLLNIDCVHKDVLARANAINGISVCVVSFLAMRMGMKLADHHPVLPFYIGAVLLAACTLVGIRYIIEPPIRSEPAKGCFKPWSAMKVAWADKRNILLMAGVGMLRGVSVCFEAWIWLLAISRLQLSRGELGAYMSWSALVPLFLSFPAGYLIDRFRGMRLVVFFWALSMISAWWIATGVYSGLGLSIAALLMALVNLFYDAANLKVFRDADRRDTGSITSTASFLRAIIIGVVIWLSGLLVENSGGNYNTAFILGAVVTTLGLGCVYLHSRLMKRSVSIPMNSQSDSIITVPTP